MRRILVAVQNPRYREAVIAALTTSGFDTVGTTPASLHDRFRHMVAFGVEPDVVVADLSTDTAIVVRHLTHLNELGYQPLVVALVAQAERADNTSWRRVLPVNAPGWQIVANVRELVGIAPGEVWR